MLIDAHAHLDKYDDDQIDEVLAEIERRSVLTLSVSVDPASFARAEAIAAQSPLVIPSFGIHPEEAPSFVDSLASIGELVNRSPLIGEIGLDHRFVTDASQYDPQREVFAFMLESARSQGKLVNLHCVGAERDTLDMLKSHEIERAIVHWYSGPLDVLTEMIATGYSFTVGVEILHSDHIRRVAEVIPDTQLLTETDNPGGLAWLTNETGRPHHLLDVLDELARLRGVPVAELSAMVQENMVRLMKGDPHLADWESGLD